jgi:anti-anti-sigma factor
LETAVVVRAAGEVDGTTAQQLEDPLLRAAETGAVQFDLAKVPYMSSAGLRVLILAAKALQKRGERLRAIKIYNVLNLAGSIVPNKNRPTTPGPPNGSAVHNAQRVWWETSPCGFSAPKGPNRPSPSKCLT